MHLEHNPANFVLHEITDSCDTLFQRFGISSNGSGYPFEKEMSSFRTTQAICSGQIVIRSKGSGYPFKKIVFRLNGSGCPFEKEVSSVQTTQVIHSGKIVIHSNSLGYPLEEIVIRSNSLDNPFKGQFCKL